jgi:ribosome-interacting GTPase 1
MTLNATPQFNQAQAKFLSAQTDEERIIYLEEMIRECPKHKSSENTLVNLRTRYKKLQEKINRSKKSRGSTRSGIKKEEMQAIIIGFTNSGKSSLINELTNQNTKVSLHESVKFTTTKPIIGMMPYMGVQIQIIENPSPNSEFFDRSIPNTADTILILITSLEEITHLKKYLEKSKAKEIIVFNKSDTLSSNEKRKIEATLKSKKLDHIIISVKDKENISELKEKIFKSFNKIRIFTKEPGKIKSDKPIVLNPGSTVHDIAEKIFHGFSKQVKETYITGPSGKFPNQKVGLKHKLKDLDTIEFKTK